MGLKIFYKFVNWLKPFKQKKNLPKSCLNFPNTITREEYYRRKTKREKLAISKTLFWDELNLDIFLKNLKLNKNNTCPYCGNTLPIRKGKTFKCTSCKNKVFRKREILTSQEGLFTEEERDILDNLWKEYNSRVKFIQLWEETNTLIKIKLDREKQYTVQSAIQQAIIDLHFGKKSIYTKQGFKELRRFRFMEAELQAFCGNITQATNTYMTILYIDLIGDYCTLYDFPEELDKETIEEFPEWSHGFIAPAIYGWAFKEDLSLEEYKKLFLFNANNLVKMLNFEPPITPNRAWEKILEYKEEHIANTN